ncbi:MAG: helix-turn-helix domain-containing protein [Sphingobium sp.]
MNGQTIDPDGNAAARRPRRTDRTAGSPPVRNRSTGTSVPIDPYRTIVFPNRVREQRRRIGLETLLTLAERLPALPYIRLSKIERGETFARATELRMIATAIGLDDAAALLIDVEDPDFSIALWAGSRGEKHALNRESEELAMLLAAAFRARRTDDPSLTLARLQTEYGLPSVIVSRIENALKPFDRWNVETITSICALLGTPDRAALAAHLRMLRDQGALTEWLARIAGAREREDRTRERIRTLRQELARMPFHLPAQMMAPTKATAAPMTTAPVAGEHRLLTVLGVPAGDGVIEPFPGPQQIAPPPQTGPNSYALRMCRASLGPIIPGHAVLIVDPDRSPVQGGLAVLREGKGLRVLSITTDRNGSLYGNSINPEREIALDMVPPADLAMVTAVLFG